MNGERAVLEHDWYAGSVPTNVVLGEQVYIDTAYSFAAFHSDQQAGLNLSNASGVYDRTAFVVGRRGRITVGAYTCLNATYLVCNDRISIGAHCFLGWGAV